MNATALSIWNAVAELPLLCGDHTHKAASLHTKRTVSRMHFASSRVSGFESSGFATALQMLKLHLRFGCGYRGWARRELRRLNRDRWVRVNGDDSCDERAAYGPCRAGATSGGT